METAKDISRPVDRMELGGKTHKLAFDLNAFRVAEDVYELEYNRNLNFGKIVEQLADGKIGAVMALMYGALVSGGYEGSWKEFSAAFKLTDIPGVRDLLIENVTKALPETDGKNPQEAPAGA